MLNRMPKTLVFVSNHRRATRVADRILGALAAQRDVQLICFDREVVDHPVYKDPRISYLSLGHVRDGVAVSRLYSIARATWMLARANKRIRISDTIVLVNSLELLIICAICGLTRFPTVYDVSDIHPLQLNRSFVGRLMRRMERRVLKQVRLVVVTSPWFKWEYFSRWLRVRTPILLIENKVDYTRGGRETRPVLSNRIAWNGLLRCTESARVLLECLKTSREALHLTLLGSLERLGEMGPRLTAQPNCSYGGKYRPEALSSLISSCSFVWAIDFADGENSKWLLPYRLYEAVSAGVPVMSVEGTATAEVVRRNDIGIVLPECTAKAILHALNSCSSSTYDRWLKNVNELRGRARRGEEWASVLDDASAWGHLNYLPNEPDVDLVLGSGYEAPEVRLTAVGD